MSSSEADQTDAGVALGTTSIPDLDIKEEGEEEKEEEEEALVQDRSGNRTEDTPSAVPSISDSHTEGEKRRSSSQDNSENLKEDISADDNSENDNEKDIIEQHDSGNYKEKEDTPRQLDNSENRAEELPTRDSVLIAIEDETVSSNNSSSGEKSDILDVTPDQESSSSQPASPTESRQETSFDEDKPLLPKSRSDNDDLDPFLESIEKNRKKNNDNKEAAVADDNGLRPTFSSSSAKTSSTSKPALRSKKQQRLSSRMATSLEDIGSLRLWKGIVAEFVGTLLLTLVGCGSCINLRGDDNVTSPVVQIALCFGLSVATIVWAIGHVSGGHINPAVTVAMLATRKISIAKAVFFIIFQLLGAVVGAGILYGLTPDPHHGNLGSTLVNDELTPGQGFGVELMITFVLVFTVFASCDNKRKDLNGSTPLTIGLSVTMCHLFAIDFTGSSMNTARSFGPAVVMGKWEHHWVYWAGPIIGGLMAGILYDHLFAVNASLTKAKACLLSSGYDNDSHRARKIKVRIIEEDPEEDDSQMLAMADKDGDQAKV